MNNKTIGILGGMGPMASADLYYKIIHLAQTKYGAEQDHEFPPMMIYNLPLVGFDETGFVDADLVKNQLIEGVKKLEQSGSDFIIIACNTVHHFTSEIQQELSIPIVSIIEETCNYVESLEHTVVGILSSESTKKLSLYQKSLSSRDIKAIPVTDDQQKIINNIILHIMEGKQGTEDTEQLKGIITSLEQQGAQSIVLGCTELPLAITQTDIDIKLFDSTDIISDVALNNAFVKPVV